jgi:serine/threonine-protein kinase
MPGEHSSQISHFSPVSVPPVGSAPGGAGMSLAGDGLSPAGISDRSIPVEGGSTPARPEEKTVISHRPPIEPSFAPLPSVQSIGQSLVGKTLDHYELLEFVGGGGMGAVFRANDTRLGRTVAVKVLSCAPTDEETIRRFRNEAQSAARLDHPNIARVYFVGESQGQNYIVFEFIEGINLRDLVAERGPLSIESALHYTLQIAEALEHSSSRDVVHRDIKPSNALVTSSGVVKLVDMGLARLHQVESSSDDLTASGVTLGTFDYISPEQARDPRAADVRSDLYSLGCTLYYMLAGQPPFPEGSAVQKLLRHSSDEPPDVRLFRPDVPAPVVSLLAKMLEKRPSLRHQTPAELAAHLTSIGQQLGYPSLMQHGSAATATLPTAEWRGAVLQWVLAAALLGVAVIALDAWLSSGGGSEYSLRSNLGAPAIAVIPPELDQPPQPGAPLPGASVPAPTPAAGVTRPVATENVASGILTGDANPPPSALPVLNDRPPDEPPGDIAAVATPALADESQTVFILAPEVVSASLGADSSAASIDAAPTPSIGLSAPSPAIKIRRIAVAPQSPALVPPDVEYVSSLAAACRRAAELGIGEIELQWNGRLLESPLEVTNSSLSLRAAAGFRPVLVFQPALSLTTDREMIRLRGGNSSSLTIQGLELRLELPPEPSFGWSLLTMNTGQTLGLADCILTVQDGDAVRPAVHDQVVMIAVNARRPSEMMTMGKPQPSMAAPTSLTFDRCIARGEATIIGMPEETPLTVRWNQGLVVTPRRLIETGGAQSSPTVFETVSLHLNAVTAICRQGLYQMKRRPGAAYQLSLDVTAQHCILMTDREVPLFEFIGAAEITSDDLKCVGEENLFPDLETIFLRLRSGQPNEAPQTFPIKQRGLAWSQERNPQVGNPWADPVDLSLPASARTKDDFVLDDPTDTVGFDPAALPEAAEPAATEAAPAADPAIPASADAAGAQPSAVE